jgi:hypothetical protein
MSANQMYARSGKLAKSYGILLKGIDWGINTGKIRARGE